MIYLDNAATSGKKPQSVINAVNYAMHNLLANPGRSGHSLSEKTALAVYGCRNTVKKIFNATSENSVCFMLNCTHAINTVLYGVLNTGDHVIISSLEHNAVLRPVNSLKIEREIQYDIAKVDMLDDDKTVNNFKRLIKPNTKLIFITAASNVVGRRLPLERIGKLCKENNIYFGVDAAQAAGVFPIDIKAMHIDYLCIASHKGLYAPMGTGVLIAEKPIEKVLITGGTGVNSAELDQPEDMPERVESGTLNVPGIAGLHAGARFVESKGISNIFDHEIKLCSYMEKNLRRAGAELYVPQFSPKLYAPVLSFNIRGLDSNTVGEHLNRMNIAVRAGLHCSPLAHRQLGTTDRGTVRVSPSVFNTVNDADRLIFAVKKLI